MERAPRNRTITLSPEEAKTLRAQLLHAEAEGNIPLDRIRNTLIMGECISTAAKLPLGFVDLLIADPPYNLDKRFGKTAFREMANQDYIAYTEAWVTAILPLLAPNASVYVCCDWRSSLAIQTVLDRHLRVRNRITWQREKGRGAKTNWKNGMEDIWFATKSDDYYFAVDAVMHKRRVLAPYRENGKPKDWVETPEGNFRLTHPSNFWDDISIPYWSMPENTDHPTQKPEKLLAKLILASSAPGDFVFDPFLGSGTTAVAAKKLGRTFSGIEIEEEYCLFAQKRLSLADANPKIQGYEDGVFWERNAKKNPKV